MTDVLRRLTLVALALSLLFAQAAGAAQNPGNGKADPRGNAWGQTGFSDGRESSLGPGARRARPCHQRHRKGSTQL